jgi:hypothetical protein
MVLIRSDNCSCVLGIPHPAAPPPLATPSRTGCHERSNDPAYCFDRGQHTSGHCRQLGWSGSYRLLAASNFRRFTRSSPRHQALLPQSTAMRSPGQDKIITPELKFRHGQGLSSGRQGKNMRESLLLNPFNPNPGPAQIVNRRATRSTPVCSNCQSDDITSHAVAQWSNESQEWQLANTFDQPAHCNGCKGPCGIVWLPLN